MYCAIIFASLPALRQLFTHWQTYGTFLPATGEPSYGYSQGSRVHTKGASTPNTLNDYGSNTVSRTGIGAKNFQRHEVGRQTDVYVELNDLEGGNGDGFANGHNGLNSNGLVIDANGLVHPKYPVSSATAEIPRHHARGESYDYLRRGH
ncbi:MAG: hypothetical protein Q9159_003246 [Coniocarpon cinnabarinum]